MKKQKVSSAVIRRLPRYYRHLNDLHLIGTERISSSALGNAMGLTASQIRQDLSCFGEFGQQGYGYNVGTLRGEISDILGMQKGHTAVVLGAGNLGRALMENFHFERSGIHLAAAFDVDAAMVGQNLAGVPIYHVDELEHYLNQHSVSVAVLTVPHSVANAIAARLVAAKVRGIWNFTNIELNIELNVADPGVIVEDVHFADSLLALSYMITEGL